MATEERQVSPRGVVLGGVVVQALRTDPGAPYLRAGRERRSRRAPGRPDGIPNTRSLNDGRAGRGATHSSVPAGAILRDVQVRVDVFQVPLEVLALQLLPEGEPLGDVPVRFLRVGRKSLIWQMSMICNADRWMVYS